MTQAKSLEASVLDAALALERENLQKIRTFKAQLAAQNKLLRLVRRELCFWRKQLHDGVKYSREMWAIGQKCCRILILQLRKTICEKQLKIDLLCQLKYGKRASFYDFDAKSSYDQQLLRKQWEEFRVEKKNAIFISFSNRPHK